MAFPKHNWILIQKEVEYIVLSVEKLKRFSHLSGGESGKNGTYQSTYSYRIGDITDGSNSCHRATTNWLGLDLKVQRDKMSII